MGKRYDGDLRWWRVEVDVHASLFATVERVRSNESGRISLLKHCAALYNDEALSTKDGIEAARDTQEAESDRVKENVVANICEALQAEVVQSKPRPLFSTEGGSWELQQRAQRLTKFVAGVMAATDFDELAEQAALDAVVFGTGAVKIFDDGESVVAERVHPGELLVDARDAYYGRPRSLYQIRWVDRDVLRETYPDEADLVDGASSDVDARLTHLARFGAVEDVADVVVVVEAWHLPSGRDADDGRHVVAVSTGVLFDEPWKERSFPFAFLRWRKPLAGFWGKSAANALTSAQVMLDTVWATIVESWRMGSTFKVFARRGTLASPVTNEIGQVVEYDGADAPQVIAPVAVSPDSWKLSQAVKQSGYDTLGLSQMAAHAQKPAGLDSGRAQRIFLDNQSKIFIAFARGFERFYLEAAEQMVRCAKRLAENDASFEVVYRGDGAGDVERIRFRDVDLDRSQYVLRCFPVSALPSTPAGKIAMLQELVGMGVISPEQFMRLADFPDFEAERNLLTADRELVEKMVQSMLSDGVYAPPESYMNLALTIQIAGRHYLRARSQGVPEERLDLLRQFITDCEALMRKSNEQPAGAAPNAPPSTPQQQAPAPPGQMAAMPSLHEKETVMSGNPLPNFAADAATLNSGWVAFGVKFNPNGGSDPATSTIKGPDGVTVVYGGGTGLITITLSPQSESYFPGSKNRKIVFEDMILAEGLQRASAGAGHAFELVGDISSVGAFSIRYLLNAAGTFSAANLGPTSGTVIHLVGMVKVREVIV